MSATSTVLWVCLIGAMSFGLFQLKYAVQDREDELARLNRDLIASEESIHVLNAEWSYLNRPERLAALAEKHLGLRSMEAHQIGTVAILPQRPPSPAMVAGLSSQVTAP